MKIVRKSEIQLNILPGRGVFTAVGKNGASVSNRMTLGWTRYAEEYSRMEPHQHAEEAVIVTAAKNAYMRVGPAKDALSERIPLEVDMVVHYPPLEWHVFEYDEGGYLEIIYIYGQVDNIRPEEIDEEDRV